MMRYRQNQKAIVAALVLIAILCWYIFSDSWKPQVERNRLVSPSKADTSRPVCEAANIDPRSSLFALVSLQVPPPGFFDTCLLSGDYHTAEQKAFAQAHVHSWRGSAAYLFERVLHIYSGAPDSPQTRVWTEYSVTANKRGAETVSKMIASGRTIAGKTVMDIGCARGGLLVAMAEKGARVCGGIEHSDSLLQIGRLNFLNNGLSPSLLHVRDATVQADMQPWFGMVDIVTASAVIEHVSDVHMFAKNIKSLLTPTGFAFLEIPNPFYWNYVLKDGHYTWFGIVLLDVPHASKYFKAMMGDDSFDSFYYCTPFPGKRLDRENCFDVFAQYGLHYRVADDTAKAVASVSVQSVLNGVAEIKTNLEEHLLTVPEIVRSKVRQATLEYIDEVESFPYEERPVQFAQYYGTEFWSVYFDQ